MATCSQSPAYLKIVIVCMIIALALHITGLATTSWSTIETELALTGLSYKISVTYLVGLWKYCVCVDVFGLNTCTCEKIDSPPDWLDATRVLACLALIGMITGCVLSFISVCQKTPSKPLKLFNIFTIVGSGVTLIIAMIVYGIESKEHIDRLLKALQYIEEIDVNSITKLGYSFILPTIAGCLCLAVCVPLLIYDLSKPPKQTGILVAPMQYNNQMQVVSYPQGPSYGNPGGIQQPHTVIMQPAVYPTPNDNSLYMQQAPQAYPSAPQQLVAMPPKS